MLAHIGKGKGKQRANVLRSLVVAPATHWSLPFGAVLCGDHLQRRAGHLHLEAEQLAGAEAVPRVDGVGVLGRDVKGQQVVASIRVDEEEVRLLPAVARRREAVLEAVPGLAKTVQQVQLVVGGFRLEELRQGAELFRLFVVSIYLLLLLRRLSADILRPAGKVGVGRIGRDGALAVPAEEGTADGPKLHPHSAHQRLHPGDSSSRGLHLAGILRLVVLCEPGGRFGGVAVQVPGGGQLREQVANVVGNQNVLREAPFRIGF